MDSARFLWAVIAGVAHSGRLRVAVAGIGALGLAAATAPSPTAFASADGDLARSSQSVSYDGGVRIESGDEDHFDHDEPAPVSPAVDLPAGLNEIGSESPWAGRWPPEIEPLASYEPQVTCIPGPRPGVAAFASLLERAYPQSQNLGITRACDIGSRSEHKEGRAYDWGVDVSVPSEREAASQVIAWLLATDEHGNDFAMARRLGVMYIIWDNHIWSSTSAEDGWRVYTGRSPHTDHVHLSFDRAGSMGLTSFWSAAGLEVFPGQFDSFALDDFPSTFHLGRDDYRSELGPEPGRSTPWREPADGARTEPTAGEREPSPGHDESSGGEAPATEPDRTPDEVAPAPTPVAPTAPVPGGSVLDPVLGPVVTTTTTIIVPPLDDVVGVLEEETDSLLPGG